MLLPPGWYCRVWTVGLVTAALTGCATGGPSPSNNDGGSERLDAASRDAPTEPPVDAGGEESDAVADAATAIDAAPPPDTAPPPDAGASTPNCEAPRWASGTGYAEGTIITAECQVSIAGTACYGQVGALFAWRCTDAAWASLRPGSDQSGWWAAWTAVERCN